MEKRLSNGWARLGSATWKGVIFLALAHGGSAPAARKIAPPRLTETLDQVSGPELSEQIDHDNAPAPGAGPITTGWRQSLDSASAAFKAGHYDQALDILEAMEPASRTRPPQDAADLWYRMGRVQMKMNLNEQSLASFERSIQLARQAPQSVRAILEPIALQARGEVQRSQGKPALARTEYDNAYKAYELSHNWSGMAKTSAEIGSTFSDEADFSAAHQRYEQARELWKHSSAPDDGRLLVNMSSLYTWLGQYESALTMQSEAIKVCSAQNDMICLASAFHAESFTLFEMGDYQKASLSAQQAVDQWGQAPGVEKARALNNLGLSQIELSQFDAGIDALNQSLDILKKVGDARDQATTMDSLGTAYRKRKAYPQAQAYYEMALPLWQQAQYPEGERDTQANLGRLMADQKQFDAAIFHLKASVNLAQRLRKNVKAMAENFRNGLTRRLEPSYQLLISLLENQGRHPEAVQVTRMLKEHEFYEFVSGTDFTPTATVPLSAAEASQQAQYSKLTDRIFKLAKERDALSEKLSTQLSAEEKARITALDKQIAQAQVEIQAFFKQLKDVLRTSGDRRNLEITNIESQRGMLSQLKPGSALLIYVSLGDELRIILCGAKNGAWHGYTVQVGQAQIEQSVAKLRQQIAKRDPAVQTTAQQLYTWLFPRDLQADLQDLDARTLLVSLDGPMRYMPVASLHDGSKWLAERYALAYYDLITADQSAPPLDAHGKISAFGLTHAVENFNALTQVRTELNAIVGQNGMQGDVFLDDRFTEDSLHDALLGHPQVLHIASHFVFQAGTEDNSFLVLGDGRHLSLSSINRFTFYQLNLLTLSACNTGMGGGRNADGREVDGLGSMAHTKGAAAVLATLWSVNDASTAEFMAQFYRQWSSGHSKAEAIQAAQRALIQGTAPDAPAAASNSATHTARGGEVDAASPEVPSPIIPTAKYAHPYYWAPFVLMGNSH